mmetsp:Transcript_9450/g.14166  ORF Transcript_9450/g.14166 Transcript_9450/m.14166 type:complete len:138 (+) Transcript_9450:15-428(+)
MAAALPTIENVKKAAGEFKEWTRLVIADDSGKIIHTTFKADSKEIKEFLSAFDDRSKTIAKGISLDGTHYVLHRWTDTVTYGRIGKPGELVGVCLHKVINEKTKKPMYSAITWGGIGTSARVVPEFQSFCKKHVVSL